MRSVARPAIAIATSGSPVTPLAYQSDENPSASACTAWSTRASIVDAQLVKPIRIASDGDGDSSGAERLDSIGTHAGEVDEQTRGSQ